jgi:hypothetical protein
LGGGLVPEDVAHSVGQLCQRLAHHWRGKRLKAQLPPIGVLPRCQHPGQLVGVAPLWVVKLRGADVIDRQDQVLAAKLALMDQEALDLGAAGVAAEKARGNDRDKQRHRVQGLLDSDLPVLTPGDVFAVLKDREFLAGLHLDLGAEPLAELGELAVVVLVIEAHVAHERGRLFAHACDPLSGRAHLNWRIVT